MPELASREHLRAIVPVVRAALEQAGVTLGELDAIAVTCGPGLAGALLVGITYAKALAYAQNLPLIAVNHLEGHIHAVLLEERQGREAALAADGNPVAGSEVLPSGAKARIHGKDVSARLKSCPDTKPGAAVVYPADEPALALVVSGGHTHLYLARPAEGTWQYTLVGRTVDDAAGEAYDKVAKLLGFGYPGGPWIRCAGAVWESAGGAVRVRTDQGEGAPGRACAADQGGEDGADCAAGFAFSSSRFRGSSGGAAVCGVARAARGGWGAGCAAVSGGGGRVQKRFGERWGGGEGAGAKGGCGCRGASRRREKRRSGSARRLRSTSLPASSTRWWGT